LLVGLALSGSVRADEGAAAAKIVVSSATAGSSLGGRLVEGRMTFREREYLLRLHGLAQSANTTGTVYGLLRPRDVAGVYEHADGSFRNAAGVTIRFDPPIVLEKDRLEVEVASRIQPKVSGGHHESGVE
jgi:hypothetical protein